MYLAPTSRARNKFRYSCSGLMNQTPTKNGGRGGDREETVAKKGGEKILDKPEGIAILTI